MTTTPSKYYLEKEENSIDLKETLLKYLRYWRWFILSLVICFAACFLYNRYAPRVYRTSAKIKILDDDKTLQLPQAENLFSRFSVNLENEIELLTSFRILEKVVENLGLTTEFYEVGRVQTSQIDTIPFNYRQILFEDSITNELKFIVEVTDDGFEIENIHSGEILIFKDHTTELQNHNLPFELSLDHYLPVKAMKDKKFELNLIDKKTAVLQLKDDLEINTVGKESEILQLSLKGESPIRSERIINELISAYNQDGVEDRQLISRRTIDFIDDRFTFLTQELDSIEEDKQDFKQRYNLVYLETNSNLSLKEKAQADAELFQIENQLAISKLLEGALNDDDNKNNLLPANIGLNNSVVNELIGQYNQASLERDKLIIGGGINNPLIRQIDGTLLELRNNLNLSVERYMNELELTKEQYDNRNNQFRSEVYQIPEKEKLLRIIERQQTIKESLYLLLLQKREEATINFAVTEPSIKVVEYALSENHPIWPKTNIIILASLIVGLLIPVITIYFVLMFDTKIHGKQDFENLSQEHTIIGEIPEIKLGKKTIFSDPNDRTMLAESFRILASNLKYILPNVTSGKGMVIYCTSASKGEGKSFISTNLSLALSSLNKKVLLVGADLRNPQLHSYAKIGKQGKGLTTFLYDFSTNWKEFTVNYFKDHPSHQLIISGDIPINPPQLLSNGRFKLFLEEAKEMFDYIVVDTAPTLLVTDTLLIAEDADVTLFITKANFTEKNILEYLNELISQKKLVNPTIVINAVRNGHKGRYGYNYRYIDG